MKDLTITNGFSPLGIRIQGSGEYVTNQLLHLQDYFDMMKHDELKALLEPKEEKF